MDRLCSVEFVVFGRVQRVGFRWFTQKAADRLGISGWVKNVGDGSVEGVAEGTPEAIEEFFKAVSVGPRFANVENVDKSKKVVEVRSHKRFNII